MLLKESEHELLVGANGLVQCSGLNFREVDFDSKSYRFLPNPFINPTGAEAVCHFEGSDCATNVTISFPVRVQGYTNQTRGNGQLQNLKRFLAEKDEESGAHGSFTSKASKQAEAQFK
jgi:hypothetical protein